MFDRFHIAEVYYHYFTRNYRGQGCPMYARLSKMLTYYTPGVLVSWDRATQDVRDDVLMLEARLDSSRTTETHPWDEVTR